MSSSLDKIETLKAECALCGGERNCAVHGSFYENGGNDDIHYWKNWYILQCKGCDYIFFQTEYTDSESYDYYHDREGNEKTVQYKSREYFPSILSRKKPEWLEGIEVVDAKKDQLFSDTIRELYGAYNAGLNMLAAVGLRTSFDVISDILGVDSGIKFQQKLKDLENKMHISSSEKDLLDQLVNAGNASAHRGWTPSNSELNTLMDIFENFVQSTLVEPKRKEGLKERANSLNESIPAKQITTKKSKNQSPD